MPYEPKTWVTGDHLTATDLNHAETGIQTAQATADAAIPAGADNQDVSPVSALLLGISTRRTKMNWTAGKPTSIQELDGDGTVIATYTLNWSGTQLTSVVTTAGGKTVTETLAYNADGTLNTVTPVVS